MKNNISKFIYYVLGFALVIVGLIVKYFLIDTNLGARIIFFNGRLLSSDIIFIVSIVFAIIGYLFQRIKKNDSSTLSESTIIISAFLVAPMAFVLALTPFLMTYYPEESGESVLSSIVSGLAGIGTITFLIWLMLIPFTFLKQIIIIRNNRTSN